MELKFGKLAFRKPDSQHDVSWAPVYFCPSDFSDEAIAFGVVARDEKGCHFERADFDKKLTCMYGGETKKHIKKYMDDISAFLKADSIEEDVFESPLPFSNFSIGECRVSLGISAKEVARSWMRSTCSLHDPSAKQRQELKKNTQKVEKFDFSQLELPMEVRNQISPERVDLLMYFNQPGPDAKKTWNDPHHVDFLAPGHVLNFSLVTSEPDTMFSNGVFKIHQLGRCREVRRMSDAYGLVMVPSSLGKSSLSKAKIDDISDVKSALKREASHLDLAYDETDSLQATAKYIENRIPA